MFPQVIQKLLLSLPPGTSPAKPPFPPLGYNCAFICQMLSHICTNILCPDCLPPSQDLADTIELQNGCACEWHKHRKCCRQTELKTHHALVTRASEDRNRLSEGSGKWPHQHVSDAELVDESTSQAYMLTYRQPGAQKVELSISCVEKLLCTHSCLPLYLCAPFFHMHTHAYLHSFTSATLHADHDACTCFLTS